MIFYGKKTIKKERKGKQSENISHFFLSHFLNPPIEANDIFANILNIFELINSCRYIPNIVISKKDPFPFFLHRPFSIKTKNQCTHASLILPLRLFINPKIGKVFNRRDRRIGGIVNRDRVNHPLPPSLPPSCPLVTFESSGAVSALQDVQLDAWRVQETSSPLFSAYNPPLHATRLPSSSFAVFRSRVSRLLRGEEGVGVRVLIPTQ